MPIRQSRWIIIVISFLVCVAAVTGGVWRYGYIQALDQLARRGNAEVTLVLDGLASDLQRYRDQAVQLAEHPTLTQLTKSKQRNLTADALLLAAADRTAAAMLFFVSPDGAVLASSHEFTPPGLIGKPYFQRAMDGALGISHGTSNEFASRVFILPHRPLAKMAVYKAR